MPTKKGERRTKAEREKIMKGLKKYYSQLGAKERHSKKISEYMKKRFSNPEERKKVSVWINKYYSNPISRKKLSELKKKQYKEHPELIARMDREITSWWHDHPNMKKERSEKVKRFFIEHPDKFMKFMKYGTNSDKPHLKTKQGFIVRSKGEKKIADFLYYNKIKSSYEAKTLIFKEEGQICIPDFYLPSYKIYIEFYGGYPAAWKKKVMKNKLYKKYKIPCIFITPAELRDLEYYLKKELK